jgi:hypothetical protein
MTSTIKVDNIQDQDGNNIINENANTITIGASGDTVTLASGASQSGFGRTGTVDWDTTAKTASFTAVSGNGYFVNTTSGAVTMTLPASPSSGDIVSFKDYANTFDTNNLTIARNGSPIGSGTADAVISVEGQSGTLIYVDGTQGWLIVNASTDADLPRPAFVTATGGTITTCGNFKIHTFTGPGTFTVSCAGNNTGSDSVDYLVVAGGGGGGRNHGGGGGAGGYRESPGSASGCYSVSPRGVSPAVALPVSAQAYPITVGGGGAGSNGTPSNLGSNGSDSTFSTITSSGGGAGAGTNATAAAGGSGGGGSGEGSPKGSGNGNTPAVSPIQGTNGGNGSTSAPSAGAGGGGGAICAGTAATNNDGAPGGNGATSSINGTPTARAGGGGGGVGNGTGAPGGTGGGGRGGDGDGTAALDGTANTGGGGGGGQGGPASNRCGGDGGSGIVIIRYKFQ